MNADKINPQSILHLRAICKLDHARVARLCGVTAEQVRELEEGGETHFQSHQLRIDAAKRIAKTLNALLPKGTPKINVFGSKSLGVSGHEEIVPITKGDVHLSSSLQPKYSDTPEFFKLMAILVVVVFLLVAVAMPLLYTQTIPKL
jgi:hypothetical protein